MSVSSFAANIMDANIFIANALECNPFSSQMLSVLTRLYAIRSYRIQRMCKMSQNYLISQSSPYSSCPLDSLEEIIADLHVNESSL